jgi:hydroxyquinol 1,2-dioxygenase
MRNINAQTITPAFLQRIAGCDDPRLKQVLGALVTHLHDFAREVQLTEAEWMAGIEFLTATGQKCSGTRQEFILLSDVLGLSMLLVAQNHDKPAGCTEATVFGPFHTDDAPHLPDGADLRGGAPGTPLDVAIEVRSLDGRVLADAEVDVWEADADGFYDVQHADLDHRRARGVLHTDAEGRARFTALLPTPYPVPTDGPVGQVLVATGRHPWRPAHLHFLIRAAGHEPLVTHIFREGSDYLDSDVVFGVRSSLVAEMPEVAPGRHQLRQAFVLNPTS